MILFDTIVLEAMGLTWFSEVFFTPCKSYLDMEDHKPHKCLNVALHKMSVFHVVIQRILQMFAKPEHGHYVVRKKTHTP